MQAAGANPVLRVAHVSPQVPPHVKAFQADGCLATHAVGGRCRSRAAKARSRASAAQSVAPPVRSMRRKGSSHGVLRLSCVVAERMTQVLGQADQSIVSARNLCNTIEGSCAFADDVL